MIRQISIGLLLTGFLLATATVVEARGISQSASEGQQIFNAKCAACHTIGGGKLVGPDLKDVTKNRSENWLRAFITNPQKVIDSGDADAKQLVKDFNGVIMPTLGLSDVETASLLEYLKNPSGAPVAEAIVQMGDPARGEKLFTGQLTFARGGPACFACHNVAGVGPLGGGSLGLDLTHAYTKFGGSAGMATTLASLPFPTMQGIFVNKLLTPDEQADLLAFFQRADQSGQTSFPVAWLVFLAAGLAGAGGLFGVMFKFWPRQSESISERLRNRHS